MHEKQIPRLNKIIGQVEGVKRMIIDGRYCPDILTQLKAVKSAVRAVEREILDAHLGGCVAESLANPKIRDRKLAEIKKLLKDM